MRKRILSMLVLLAAVVTGAVAQTTYNVTLKTGTVDDTNWTISPTEAAADATVTATYSGTKNVRSVKAVKKKAPEGAINGKFTINSNGNQIYFSKGNLQATNATANSEDGWVWSFAEHQYDFIGNVIANTAVGNNVITTSGTIDLFGWVGTTSTLVPYGINSCDNLADYCMITTDGLKSDWGRLPISNGGNTANSGWRTPTVAEWEYILTGRPGAASKAGYATVGGKTGIIILPDEFTDPMKNNGSGAFVPQGTTGYDANVYTAGGNWEAMEANGAVFLPACGSRLGSTWYSGIANTSTVGDQGGYWSSTCVYGITDDPTNTRACYVRFSPKTISVGTSNNTQQRYGLSVRLVHNETNQTYPIALSAVTEKYIGSVVTADGYVYATEANAKAAGKIAVAMIIYVGSSTIHDFDNDFDYKCLALALQDEEGTKNWGAANTACSNKNTSTPVTNAKWMLPSQSQWNKMIDTCGSYKDFRDGFTSVGGENMQPAGYWSATETGISLMMYYYNFKTGSWGNDGDMSNSSDYRVRACLAF